jgi:histone H3/H4
VSTLEMRDERELCGVVICIWVIPKHNKYTQIQMSRTKRTEIERLTAKKHTVTAKRVAARQPPPSTKKAKKVAATVAPPAKAPAKAPAKVVDGPAIVPARRKMRKHAGTGASQRMYQMQKGPQQYVLQKANFRRMALMCLQKEGLNDIRVSKNYLNTLQTTVETFGRSIVRQACAFVDARGQTKLSRDDLMRCRVVPEVPIRSEWFV